MRRMRVYVAGPYVTGTRGLEVLENIKEGIRVGHTLLWMGMAPYIPWLDFQLVLCQSQNCLSIEDYRENSLAYLEVSDVVFCHELRKCSEDTAKEIELACELGVPIAMSWKELMKFWEKWRYENSLSERS